MKKIEDIFIPSFEANVLSRLGFKEDCFAWYNFDTLWFYGDDMILDGYAGEEDRPNAPTWEQAFDFFRDTFKLNSYIKPNISGNYSIVIKKDFTEKNLVSDINKTYDKYDDAKYGLLTELIKICQIN